MIYLILTLYCLFHSVKIEASHENGFRLGSKIEMTHSDNKYWVAEIVGDFGGLLSLQWYSTGKPCKTFFHDLNDDRSPLFYPLGHYKSYTKEFPNMVREAPAEVVDTVLTDEEYLKMINESDTTETPLALYQRRGLSLDLFKVGVTLQISLKEDPTKHWFAQVVKNVGGRLLLQWVSCPESQPLFWLFFCHPRVNVRGKKLDSGVTYEPPVFFEGWQQELEKIRSEWTKITKEDAEEELRNYMIYSAQKTRPQILKEDSAIKEGNTVLIFPSNLLKLLPVTVEKKVVGKNWFNVKGNMKLPDTEEESEVSFWIPQADNNCILPYSWAEENEIPIESSDLPPASSFKVKSSDRISEFKANGRIEVVHPDDPDKVCEAVIIRVTPPLIWSQVSAEKIHVLPFNSTDMFPAGWSQNNDYPLTKLLPKNGKKETKSSEEGKGRKTVTEDENSGLDFPQSPQYKGWCPRIYFNYKCFTGPSLSKSKLCNLPRFVGPGPVLLVMQEVISKILSIAYVSSRILNDLASEQFADLLEEHNIVKVEKVQFKAKYNNSQKTARLEIPIIRSSEKIEEFCHLICAHLKCCFNLFGPKLYDGDTCPSKCRGLTKSNKILKRPDFFRQQAITASQYLKGEIEVATFDHIKLDMTTKGVGRGRKPKRPVDTSVPGVGPGSNSNSGSDMESKKRRVEDGQKQDKRKKKLKGNRVEEIIDETTQSSTRTMDESPVTQSPTEKENKSRVNGKSESKPKMHSNPLTWDVMKVFKYLNSSNSSKFASHFRDHVSTTCLVFIQSI